MCGEIRLLWSWQHFDSILLREFSPCSKLIFEPSVCLGSSHLTLGPFSSTKEDCGFQSKPFQGINHLSLILNYEWFSLCPQGLLKQILTSTEYPRKDRGWEAWPEVNKIQLVITQNHRDLDFYVKSHLCKRRHTVELAMFCTTATIITPGYLSLDQSLRK